MDINTLMAGVFGLMFVIWLLDGIDIEV